MKKRISFLHSVVIVFLLLLLIVSPVSAHGDDARIEVSQVRLNPGSVLDIRGVGFEPETEVTLLLTGSQVNVPLGTATADMEGTFLLTLALPADLAEGTYVVRGTTNDDHSIDSPQLTIWGTAVMGSADGEPREEDDGLLAPMPTLAAGAPTPQMASVPVKETVPAEESSVPYGWIGAAVGIALIALTILVLRLKR
jgi:hypothetical protein